MKNTLLALSMAVAMTGLFTQCQSSGNNQQPAEQTALIPIPQTVSMQKLHLKYPKEQQSVWNHPARNYFLLLTISIIK